MTVHLELMSKPKLIAIARGARAAIARAEAEAAYWKSYADRVALTVSHTCPDLEWDMARRMLAEMGPDPEAGEHLADLDDATRERGVDPKQRGAARRAIARRRTARTDLQESA